MMPPEVVASFVAALDEGAILAVAVVPTGDGGAAVNVWRHMPTVSYADAADMFEALAVEARRAATSELN